jgi:chromosome segregation ATPase
MITKEDVKRVVRGPADLEERIEQLEKQKELLKFHCKKAGARIKELEKDREFLKGDIDRLTEDKYNLEILLRK